MLIIRLRRTGKRNQAQYRIVVAEKTSPIKGKFLDLIGTYNPHTKAVVVDKEKLFFWIGNGSQISNSVAKLVKLAKIIHPKISVKLNVKKLPRKKTDEAKIKSPSKQSDKAEEPLEENPAVEVNSDFEKEEKTDHEILDSNQEAPDIKPQEDNKQEKGE